MLPGPAPQVGRGEHGQAWARGWTGPELATQEALRKHQLQALPSAARLPTGALRRARPGPGSWPLPRHSTPWPLPGPCPAASHCQPSRAGRLEAAGQAGVPPGGNHLGVGSGETGSQRESYTAPGALSWSGCSPVASLPWPRWRCVVWAEARCPRGSRSGWVHHGALGGICVALSMGAGATCSGVAGRGQSEDGAGGEVTEPLAPWQTPRTDFSRLGGRWPVPGGAGASRGRGP